MSLDLRSDTVTRPSPEMLEAMMSAEVGDDVFGADPTVNALQEKAAQLFGTEAALFCPSGTMTNQIAIRAQTYPGGEVIVEQTCHTYLYEGGGISSNSGCSVALLSGDRGRLTAAQVASKVKADDPHFPVSQLVSLENTCNKGGGAIYDFNAFGEIRKVCDQHNLKLHLDGARLFNALVETPEAPSAYGEVFDSISVCLSKGLGCPVGSLLLGSKELIARSVRIRKVFGGGMRQAGYLAAAGIYALDHNVERLREDHAKAQALAELLKGLPYVAGLKPVDTNILVYELAEGIDSHAYLATLAEAGLLAVSFGGQLIRLVTHLDFSEQDLEQALSVLKKVSL